MKTLIVSGGNIKKIFFKDFILKNKFDNIIASDKGLETLDKFNIKPNYIIGDFDSINLKILDKYINDNKTKIIKLNPIKDYTDTHMALKLAIKLKSEDITIIGAIGTRIDHTIANINILKEALKKEIVCRIVNENNSIMLIDRKTTIEKDDNYKYISLIPLTSTVDGITLKGFKYSLNNSKIKIGESIGVSNEQIKQKAIIEIKKGILIVIKSND